MINELTPKVNELLSELGRLQKKNILNRRDAVARRLSGDAKEPGATEKEKAELEARVKLRNQMARIEYKLRNEKEYQDLMGFSFSEQNGMTNYMIGRRLLEIYEQLRVRAEIWNAGRKERQEIEGLFYALSYYMERATDEMEKMLATMEKPGEQQEEELDPIMKMLEAGKPEHHIYRLYNGRIQ